MVTSNVPQLKRCASESIRMNRGNREMTHPVSSPLRDASLARLDDLMAVVASSPNAKSTLLLEHLRTARTYLLGAMLDEYEFSLVNAKEYAAEKVDPTLQQLVEKSVQDLLDACSTAIKLNPTPPPPVDLS